MPHTQTSIELGMIKRGQNIRISYDANDLPLKPQLMITYYYVKNMRTGDWKNLIQIEKTKR